MIASIAVIDDHGLFARSVAIALRTRGFEVRPVQPAPAAAVAAEVVTEDTDLVLLDVDLGVICDEAELVGRLTATGLPVLLVTGVRDDVRRARCVAAGAVGMVDKAGSFDDLVAGIDQVLAAGTLLTKHEHDRHLELLRAHEREERARLAPFAGLSPREAEVLGESMRGQTVEQIAATSSVSVATVRSQIRAIHRKLDVSTQVAAIARARAAGWVPPQERDTGSA